MSQVRTQARRGEIDQDLAVLVYGREEIFRDLFPEEIWDEVGDLALNASYDADVAAGYVDRLAVRRQMWKSKAFHKHMCGS